MVFDFLDVLLSDIKWKLPLLGHVRALESFDKNIMTDFCVTLTSFKDDAWSYLISALI